MAAAPRHITFHYTLRDESGRVLDTSGGGTPMAFVEGAGQIIEGLEEQLTRMAAGEKRAVAVPPERAYGPHDATLVQKVPRARLPVEEVRVGDQYKTGPDRSAPVVTVLGLEGGEVLLDANHPLAGQKLHFEVEVVALRAATHEELQQGRNLA